jgi:competence protein ComEC
LYHFNMKWRRIPLLVLVLGNVFAWSVPVSQGFSVSFLDVGQGDAIFIESPAGVQLLVDGGADSSVLRELGFVMPAWDRTIDAVVATHPDKDHIGGLVDVLDRYEVGAIIDPGIEHDTAVMHSYVNRVQNEKANVVIARRGMRLLLGRGAYADILFPNQDVSNIKDTNAGSVIMRVVYGGTSFMLTGDSPAEIEKRLTMIYHSDELESTVLKSGHHGSKTANAEEFIDAVNPKVAIFSRGCDNTYGHPAPEIVERFRGRGVATLDTCEAGTVTFESDGKILRIK